MKQKEIQEPLRYNTIDRIKERAELAKNPPREVDTVWTEPKIFPQWRFPDPEKWTGSDFGITFASQDAMTSLLEGISRQKYGSTIASTEIFSSSIPRTIDAPSVSL